MNYVDPDGKVTQLVFGRHTENNVFGHVAIAINGTVFSYGTAYVREEGDWGVSLEGYLAAQEGRRETQVMTLAVSAEEEADLLQSLTALDPSATAYSILSNSCVTVCEQALEQAGVLKNEPGPVTVDSAGDELQEGAKKSPTPGGLVGQMDAAGLIEGSEKSGQRKISKLRSLWNTIKSFFGVPRE